MKKKISCFAIALTIAALCGTVLAQSMQRRSLSSRMRRNGPNANQPTAEAPRSAATGSNDAAAAAKESSAFNWDAAPVDIVLQAYGERVGKTILKDPQVPAATITLKSQPGQKLSQEEYLSAIEAVLEMNQIHLEPYLDSFIRALPRKDVRKEGVPLIMDPETKLKETERVVSMWIPFKNISTEEAQKALEGFKSASGILLVFERTNSILVTDTEQNINRMLEIAKAIDIATPVGEVVEYIQIQYANANDVKSVIDAIVQESQKEAEKNGKAPAQQQQQRPSPFGARSPLLNRNRQQQQQQAPVNNESLVMSVSDADRGMIRGKVVTIADERSNKILIITSASNMKFFKEVIAALDVETTPDVQVKVYRLKYAEAEDVSDMINDLIGNSVSSKSSGGKANQNQNARQGTSGSVTRGQSTAKKPANQRSGESKAGELNKDNVTVLADKRINGIVVMARKEDIPTLDQIIEAMDVKLDQVLIETVIIEVGLNDQFKTGIDWVKGMQTTPDGQHFRQAIGGGGGSASAIGNAVSNAVESVGAGIVDGIETMLPSTFAPGSGLTYALFSEKFDLGAVISASKSDNNTKYLASPIVMTVDNKEATINATRMKYLLKGFTSSGNSYSTIAVPDYEQKELGIEIKVTPKINPKGTVMLTVEEKYTQVGDSQTIQYSTGTGGDGGLRDVAVPTTITREMSADVMLDNAQTVVFGGLTETTASESQGGIPFLMDIPVIGKYLFGKTETSEDRRELLVFMTPYVIKDGDEAEAEALRRKQSLSDQRPWQDHGWSKSKLADPITAKEQLRRQKEEWKKLDEEHQTGLDLEKAKKNRVKELKERAKKEAEKRRQEIVAEQEEADAEAKEEVKAIEKNIKEIDAQEEKRARQRAEDDLRARESNTLLQKLHEEYGIGQRK